jgi:hypothetical protein
LELLHHQVAVEVLVTVVHLQVLVMAVPTVAVVLQAKLVKAVLVLVVQTLYQMEYWPAVQVAEVLLVLVLQYQVLVLVELV